MIYLIGGSSHVGKTLLAQKLLERTGYPYVCLDHLKMGFIRSGMTDLTVEDDDEMRSFLWPFAAEMIKTAVENKQNMIVEGCYIPADWKDSFDEKTLAEIRCLFLVMSEDYIREHFADITGYADAIEKRMDDHLDMGRLISCSAWFKEECEKHKVPCFVIDKKFSIKDMIDAITDQEVCIPVRFRPEMKDELAAWFHERWGVPLEAYLESIVECLENKGAVPQWYAVMRGEKIIAGCGVIENDFHERTDLAPNVCAVYVDSEYRNRGIAGRMLNYVCEDMAELGVRTLYLLTDHTGFYERYGWEFLCMAKGSDEELSRMYVHRFAEDPQLNK